MVGRTAYGHRNGPKTAACTGIEQVVRKQRVQAQHGVAIETDVLRLLDEEIDGRLVVQDHLRFERTLVFADIAMLEQTFGLQQRVGVSLEAAGVPGEIDQQSMMALLRIGSGGTCVVSGTAPLAKAATNLEGKVEGLVRPVAIEEHPVVSDGATGLNGRVDRPLYGLSLGGEGDTNL